MSRTFKASLNIKHLLTNKRGQWAEEHAESYLLQRGLNLVARNYSCQWGEIDLIMLDRNTLSFVEVKYRKDGRYGGGLESIDYHKQRKLQSTAMYYLQTHDKLAHYPCRFDALLINGQTSEPTVNWIKNAF